MKPRSLLRLCGVSLAFSIGLAAHALAEDAGENTIMLPPGSQAANLQEQRLENSVGSGADECKKLTEDYNDTSKKRSVDELQELQKKKDKACNNAFASHSAVNGTETDSEVEGQTAPSAESVAAANSAQPKAESNIPAVRLGADRADQEHYNPPKNPIINGKEASWAKIESFNQFFEEKGLSENARAGLAGNLQHESGAFYLNRWRYENGEHILETKYGASSRGDYMNGKYTSFGIAQYHNGRATDMANFVGADSLTPQGLQGTTNAQYEYLFQDLKKQLSSKDYAAFTSGNISVDQATGIIADKYEIPKAVSGERYGRMGGTDRFNSANTLLNVMTSDPIIDASGGTSYVPTGANITNRGGSLFNTGNSTIDALLNGNPQAALNNLMGGGNANLMQMLSGLMNGGGGGSSEKDEESGSSSSGSGSGKGSKDKTVITQSVKLETSKAVVTTVYSDGSKKETHIVYAMDIDDASKSLSNLCGGNITSGIDAFMLAVDSCVSSLK